DEVRGEPLFSLLLQSLVELDNYKDSAQRKAYLNSIIPMWIQKTEAKPGTRPISSGASAGRVDAQVLHPDDTARTFKISELIPGMIPEVLQHGENIITKDSTGTDINLSSFEASIISTAAWALEIPPEVLMLQFANNYSASRGAVIEFVMYLDKSRLERAEEFDEPVYQEWLLAKVLNKDIKAPGLLEAWLDPSQIDIFAAWTTSDWTGAVKPSVDRGKDVKAYKGMIEEGWTTRKKVTRELTGQSYDKVVKELESENKKLAKSIEPLLKLQAKYGSEAVDAAIATSGISGMSASGNIEEIAEQVQEIIAEEQGV
ncbi:phage portal protein, partial [Candidatus Pacearchaeota archaeon]|nr:phage portal protein [Candidatus Pacearchaeota archaeon]